MKTFWLALAAEFTFAVFWFGLLPLTQVKPDIAHETYYPETTTGANGNLSFFNNNVYSPTNSNMTVPAITACTGNNACFLIMDTTNEGSK